MGTQETIIYWLVMRNQRYDTLLPILIFWAAFDRKMGVATTHAPMGIEPQNPPKKLAHFCFKFLIFDNKVEIFKIRYIFTSGA